MPLFLCRWPNGDCSLVLARSRDEAIIELDEVGDAESCDLWPLREFQAHFALTDRGDLALEHFGEETRKTLFARAYPALDAVLDQAVMAGDSRDDEDLSPEWRNRIEEAVEQERSRRRAAEGAGSEPETELGRDLKSQTGMPTVLVDRVVREGVTKKLKGVQDPGGTH